MSRSGLDHLIPDCPVIDAWSHFYPVPGKAKAQPPEPRCLKLLKQFSDHPRKSEVVKGMGPETLAEIPSYAPGLRPTVPGHEVVCRIVAVGEGVRQHRLHERCLVQTDYRTLRTANSNAAFGYNFEGGLQEYVLMDERVIIDPTPGPGARGGRRPLLFRPETA